MSDNLDLSLPAKAPSMARHHDQPVTLHPAALYTLVDLTDEELQDLQRECESGCIETGHQPGSSVHLAPRSRFVGQPLRDVFDYHLELGTQDTFEPRYFIVTVDKDWRPEGVILVALDDDELECNVDSFRIKAVDSGLSVVNLQIGNTSWEEEKECYEFNLDNGGDDDADDGDNDYDDYDDDDDGPPAPTKNVPLGYYIPIYIHSSLSEDKVIPDLEPAFNLKSPDEIASRVQAKLTPASSISGTTSNQDVVQQAVTLHPRRCAKNKYLHKTHILVIDTADPVENGMLMVKLPSWDATEKRTKTDLDQIGRELALAIPPPISIPYSCYYGLQERFLTLANGDADWPSEDVRAQPVFLVFQYNTHGKELGFGDTSIDPAASKRKPGEERLKYVHDLFKRRERATELVKWNYDEAVRGFPWMCRENRFIEGLHKTFFICVDGDDVAITGVLLVRREWDGNVWGRT
ncbi:predicted protein [Paecilomyces variotii No. 5]|uniref:Uncharacterized protein n=1 Tax=Byssochlamys spectabilis (strain No. 5 / NBRC 109023) TaxID=1356009 RepID=V5FS45_BYSSN|nr:predicted protein [Paecilomyces variotii No. 5]